MTSPLYQAGKNWGSEAARLRQAGISLPHSPTAARQEAINVATAVQNRSLVSQMNRSRLGGYRGRQHTGANMQIAMPKIRQPLSSLSDKGIPFNTEDEEELKDIRRWCNTPDAPVWMGDYTFKAIGDIEPGEQVIGWDTRADVWGSGRRELVKTTVLAVNRRMAPEVVKITFESGRTVKCTPDHEWLRYYVPGPDGRITNGPEAHLGRRDGTDFKVYDSEYAPLKVGSVARSVIKPTQELDSVEKIKAASWLAGIIDGEGSWTKRTLRICQSEKVNPAIVARIDKSLDLLGMTYSRYVRHRERMGNHYGDDMVVWDICRGQGKQGDRSGKNRQQLVDLYNWAQPAKMDVERMDAAFLSRNFGEPETVVSIESIGPGEVVSMQTTTGNYTAWGIASKNCRLFYSTHDLVPLLIDIYASFPTVGLEFSAKDPLIERFYTDMFLGDDLNYLEFLPTQFSREYFLSGEVTSLAHFNESLGIWSSEEILNPDTLRISRSLFVQQDRVQLMVKEMVDSLRNGPSGTGMNADETPSERLQRTKEWETLAREYPEIIQAAAQDDGLDISDALISRVVNRATPWARRGTPFLLRSFRTLMMEESLNAAQDSVCDRLYSPMVLATLGVPDLGDGEPWIPDQSELDDVRDDMQAALAADFRLLVHNFGLKIESVFGRESVPNLDNDYARVERKLLQAWGIGEALISGGTGGAYASSALNREIVTQIMVGHQNALRRHIIKRAEIVAEAQGHYDYDLKGGVRVPIYREIVEVDPETGEERIRKVPKLLIPEIKFSCVVPGTQVLTPTGMKDMGDLVAGDPVIAWDEDEQEYVHDYVRSTGPRPPEPAVTVTVHSGKSVTCTRDHPFFTQRGWVAAAALKTSDLVRTSAGAILSPMIQARHTPDSLNVASVLGDGIEVVNNDIVRLSKGGVFCSPFPATLPTSDETWELLGHYVARGSSSRGTTVRWYTKNLEVRERIEHLIAVVFGDVKISQSSGGIAVYSRPLAQWLTAMFGGESPTNLDQIRLLDASAARVLLDAVTAGEPVLAHAVPAVHRALHEMALSTGYKNDDLIPDEDIARFLGLLVGDGNYSTTHVALESMDQEIIDFAQSVGSKLGLQTTVTPQRGSKSSKVTFSRLRQGSRTAERNVLHSLLRGEEMWGHDGHHKRVPSFVWSRGAEVRAAFLSGYLDADGTVTQTKKTGQIAIRWCSVNRELLNDCQVLLESLSIRSTVRTYQVPLGVKLPQGGSPGRIGDCSHLTVGHRIDRKLCQQVLTPLISRKAEKLGIPISERTHVHVRDVCWDQVVSVIDAGQQETVALEVAKNHSHITSGLGTSNTLNLRDEAQERAFIAQLKAMGVPVSDRTLAVNIDMEFDQELERQADESVSKLMATAQAMKKVQDLCDAQNLPYPPELAQHLMATLQLRQGMSQTETAEIQAEVMGDQAGLQIEQIEMQKAMLEQQMAGGAPMLPPGAPPPGQGGPPPDGGSEQGGGPPPGGGGPPPGQGAPPAQGPNAPGPGAPGPGGAQAGFYASLNVNGPMATPPGADGPAAAMGPELPPGMPKPTEIPRNRQRPAESDDNRKFMPAQTTAKRKRTRKGEVVEQLPRRMSRFERGPSSYGASRRATEEQVERQVDRLAAVASFRPGRDPRVADLINDPDFYRALNATAVESQLRADWPEIQAGGAEESRRLLDDMLEQFYEIFNSWPQW